MLPGFNDADGGAKGDDGQRPQTPRKGKVKVVKLDAPSGTSHDPRHGVRQRWQQPRKRATQSLRADDVEKKPLFSVFRKAIIRGHPLVIAPYDESVEPRLFDS